MSYAYARPGPSVPWAEIVPAMPALTVDELHAIPDDGWVYELVQGVLVRMPLSSFGASLVSSRLHAHLQIYVEEHGLGAMTGEQGGYRLDPAYPLETEVAPGVAFMCTERVPSPDAPDYYKRAPQLAPDLAVEVVSENQFAPGVSTKAALYLTVGTRLVWVIWPRYKRVDVWHPGDERPTALGVEGILDGEDVVPGFRFPIARLFP